MVETRRYFDLEERRAIAKMWQKGMKVPDIAAALGRQEGTVYKELRRGYDGTTDPKTLRRTYDPVLADNRIRQVMSERGRRNASNRGPARDC